MKEKFPFNGTNTDGTLSENDPMALLIMREAFDEIVEGNSGENKAEKAEEKEQ